MIIYKTRNITSCTSDITQNTINMENYLNMLVLMYEGLDSENKMKFLDIILKKDI